MVLKEQAVTIHNLHYQSTLNWYRMSNNTLKFNAFYRFQDSQILSCTADSRAKQKLEDTLNFD